jgi:hypothetical protein
LHLLTFSPFVSYRYPLVKASKIFLLLAEVLELSAIGSVVSLRGKFYRFFDEGLDIPMGLEKLRD